MKKKTTITSFLSSKIYFWILLRLVSWEGSEKQKARTLQSIQGNVVLALINGRDYHSVGESLPTRWKPCRLIEDETHHIQWSVSERTGKSQGTKVLNPLKVLWTQHKRLNYSISLNIAFNTFVDLTHTIYNSIEEVNLSKSAITHHEPPVLLVMSLTPGSRWANSWTNLSPSTSRSFLNASIFPFNLAFVFAVTSTNSRVYISGFLPSSM